MSRHRLPNTYPISRTPVLKIVSVGVHQHVRVAKHLSLQPALGIAVVNRRQSRLEAHEAIVRSLFRP